MHCPAAARWVALATFGPLVAACEGPPSPSAAREWTPVDHHSQDDTNAANAQGAARQGSPPPDKNRDPGQLVDLAWRQQCATCHGAGGKGDGPMGPMLRAPDLTLDAWQAKASDADMAAVILTGRNKMPRFDLPPEVVRGLVARIRSLRGS